MKENDRNELRERLQEAETSWGQKGRRDSWWYDNEQNTGGARGSYWYDTAPSVHEQRNQPASSSSSWWSTNGPPTRDEWDEWYEAVDHEYDSPWSVFEDWW